MTKRLHVHLRSAPARCDMRKGGALRPCQGQIPTFQMLRWGVSFFFSLAAIVMEISRASTCSVQQRLGPHGCSCRCSLAVDWARNHIAVGSAPFVWPSCSHDERWVNIMSQLQPRRLAFFKMMKLARVMNNTIGNKMLMLQVMKKCTKTNIKAKVHILKVQFFCCCLKYTIFSFHTSQLAHGNFH